MISLLLNVFLLQNNISQNTPTEIYNKSNITQVSNDASLKIEDYLPCNYLTSTSPEDKTKKIDDVYINRIYYDNDDIVEIDINNSLFLIESESVCKSKHNTTFKLNRKNQQYLLDLVVVAFINKLPVDITFKTASIFEGSSEKCCTANIMATIDSITLKNN